MELTMTRLVCLATQTPATDFVDGFSNLNRLLRALVHCRRLFQRRFGRLSPAPLDPITVSELDRELLTCIQQRQQQFYATEIEALERGRPVATRSPLKTLLLFIDDSKILRVGGRLEHSTLFYPKRHPATLDGKCRLAELLTDWAHT